MKKKLLFPLLSATLVTLGIAGCAQPLDDQSDPLPATPDLSEVPAETGPGSGSGTGGGMGGGMGQNKGERRAKGHVPGERRKRDEQKNSAAQKGDVGPKK